jgi:DNA-directed RNA polymerase specialized sigma24 family protein
VPGQRPDRPDVATATTDELARMAAAGSTDAFARLIRLHGEAVTRLAWLVTGNMPAAADAAKAAWVVAWTAIRRPHDPVALEPWVSRLAVVEAMRVVRQAVGGVSVPGSQAWTGESALALGILDPPDRAVLALHHLAGLDPGELDRVTRRPEGTTAGRLPGLWASIGVTRDSAQAVVERMAAVPVRPIDADAIARLAHAEEGEERLRLVSVAIGTVAGVTVTLFPVIARVIFGR